MTFFKFIFKLKTGFSDLLEEKNEEEGEKEEDDEGEDQDEVRDQQVHLLV